MKKQVKLMLGDNMESLKKIPDNSIDSIVTDPPYGLSFMNKKWDYEVPSIEFWKEVYRVLKPGGHVLSFGGTRTYHRMVVNIEDAGFEIRDQVMWLYASGFPKSHNIGKAVDKIEGNEREVIGKKTGGAYSSDNNNGLNNYNIKEGIEVKNIRGEDFGKITKGTSKYEGWGTALKPANEPICVARKPLSEKTIVDNVIKWGTGGINIDGCRIGFKCESDITKTPQTITGYVQGIYTSDRKRGEGFIPEPMNSEGRFPANILFDETAAELLDDQSGISKSTKRITGQDYNKKSDNINIGGGNKNCEYLDKGGASRFFYVAKVSKKERNLGLDTFEEKMKGLPQEDYRNDPHKPRPTPTKNVHPTLKPINLMTYLCRLVTPPGGIVLDPFMGSGSTGISAMLEGFRFIGMEMDEDYFKIAEARINSFEEYRKLLKK